MTFAKFSSLLSFVAFSSAWVASASAQLVGPSYATAQGNYYSDGSSEAPLTSNYLTGVVPGVGEVRSFFVFNRPLRPAPVGLFVSATLEIFNPGEGYFSADPTETVAIRAYAGGLPALVGGTGGVGAFSGLGAGTLYGSASVGAPGDPAGEWVSFGLNSAFLNFLNSGGSGQFALGGSLTSLSGDPDAVEAVFAFSSEPFARLTYQYVPVPEPSTYGLIGAAMLSVVVWRRRAARVGRV